MRQQHNSVTVAPKYICNMAWGGKNPPPPFLEIQQSFFSVLFFIKSWMHKMYRMFVHIKWWCCTEKKKLVTQVYHICHVARSEEDTMLTFMWCGPCSCFALSKLPLMQGPIDIQKQVRQNEEKRIYEPQPLMHLSPHFLASFTVYSWLANYEFYLKADPT